jgi:hypothetical protein
MPTSPRVWTFNEADRQAYAGRYWRYPTRLVTERLLAEFWREPGTRRGGWVVTSLSPVLALHPWPGQAGAEKEWTGPTYVSRRWRATLAGINKDSVTAAYQRLRVLNLMTLERRSRERHEGGYEDIWTFCLTRNSRPSTRRPHRRNGRNSKSTF